MVNGIVNAKVTMDGAGRIVLPKAIRERLGLSAGAELEVVLSGDELRMRPASAEPVLSEVDGWWVHRGVPARGTDLASAVDVHRDRRLEDLSE